jgi:hypothetical protein
MSISVKGFNEKYITLLAGESCTVGSPVNITANDTAADCTSGAFAGICAAKEGDLALVQVTGSVTVPADSGLTVGAAQVVAAAGGKVNAGTGGRWAIVASVQDGVAEMILL